MEIVTTWGDYASTHGITGIAELETSCWAPWLAAEEASLTGRIETFDQGQLIAAEASTVLATLSLNQILWDGNPESLPNWDSVAGDPTTYERTYTPHGNTLCLMSMNVSEEARGKRLPQILVAKARSVADVLKTPNLIGSFRPSGYGSHVDEADRSGVTIPTFEEYVNTANDEGFPVDPWLRSLTRNGMRPLAIDPKAMNIPVTKEEFLQYKQPEWRQIDLASQTVWWCGETGFFYEQVNDRYTYKEGNVWGSLNEEHTQDT